MGIYADYVTRLVNAFNPAAANGVMCRSLVSVGYDGRLYDCDFNQMLDLQLGGEEPLTEFSFNYQTLTSGPSVLGLIASGSLRDPAAVAAAPSHEMVKNRAFNTF